MILLLAIFFICFEAIGEGLIKKHFPDSMIFDAWFQWFTAILLFAIWLMIVWDFEKYIPLWKLMVGMVLVRFALFDVIWNLTMGLKWNYYGTTKLYDRIMFELGGWGMLMKGVCLIVGICFLLGLS